MVCEEVSEGDGDGIAEAAIVCRILHFLCHDITAVDETRNVADVDGAIDVFFADFDFL